MCGCMHIYMFVYMGAHIYALVYVQIDLNGGPFALPQMNKQNRNSCTFLKYLHYCLFVSVQT